MDSHLMKPSLLLYSIFLISSTCLLVNCSSSSSSSSSSSFPTLDSNIASIKALCESTPYPDVCFDTLKFSISIHVNPNILTFLLHSLQTALAEAEKLSNLFSKGHSNIVEKQKGTLQDCDELHQITMYALKKSVSRITAASNSRKLADAKTFLSAALANKFTCLEGLETASGSSKQALINSINDAYKYISNALSLIHKQPGPTSSNGQLHRRLMGFPRWMSKKDRRILQSSNNDDDDDSAIVLTVAADGTGNFTTISDAINFAPRDSVDRIFIYIKAGMYKENVLIPVNKPNIVLLGDGSDVTVITGDRNAVDGWTTYRSATVAVQGEGFLARDITFENTAGPEKHQAVALRINADFSAVYKCVIKGFQDSLYVHSFRQFFRECDIYGTIDYIFGDASVVFQGCLIVSRMPMSGQKFTVITAQSRAFPEENTGISIQNCSILPTEDLYNNLATVKNYLGRPWRNYSRTVFIKSYIDDHIAQEGWTIWSGDDGLNTLYYGEYDNNGPGSSTDNRVTWQGYRTMNYYDAAKFKVSELITADEWLDSTSFPYDSDV